MVNKTRSRNVSTIVLGGAYLAILCAILGWRAGIRFIEVKHFILFLLRNLSLLILVVMSAFGFGALLVHKIKIERTRSEFYLFAIATGLGIQAHLIFLAGALRLLYPIVAYLLLLSGILIAGFDIVFHRDSYRDKLEQMQFTKPISWFSLFLCILLLVNALYPLLADGLIPPLRWDEVAYHLAIPKIYSENHALTYIPFIPYSNWPLEIEMLFTMSLLLSSEILPHLIVWTTLLLTCWGLYLLGRRYFEKQVGLLSAVIFASTPMVGNLAGTALIEIPLTLYTLLATLAFLFWLETNESKYWILTALFSGLNASTKLNGALLGVILGILMLIKGIIHPTEEFQTLAKRFILFGLLAFAVVAPWYIKSWVQTGNPIWPFLQNILGGRNWDRLGTEYLLGFIRSPNMPLNFKNWLLGLGRLTLQSSNFGPQYITLGWHYLPALPLVILPLIFSPPSTRRWILVLCVLGTIYYTMWFFQTHQTRFLMPTLPVLAVLASSGVSYLWSERNFIYRTLTQILLLFILTTTSWVASPASRKRIANNWTFMSGQLTRQEFLASQIPGYEIFTYVNKNLPTNARILLALYESRGYYLEQDYMWANPISQRALRLERFNNSKQLAEELQQAYGVTHIIFRSDKLDSYTHIRYGDTITQLFEKTLAEHAHPILTSSDLKLYELSP